MFLLRAVQSLDTHLPDRGLYEALYQQVHKTFMDQVPLIAFMYMHKPSCKTLADRFERFVGQRRDAVWMTSKAPGIIEKHGEKEALIDDLIPEKDDKDEALRAEKKIEIENEKQLVAARENIRGTALKRGGSSDVGIEEAGSDNGSGKKKSRRQQESSVSMKK